jgi:uncharacterized protein (TIGR02594 family)
MNTVRQGDVGDDVAALQVAIGVTADGVFGPATARALRARQSELGLLPDAVAGPRTWAALGVEAPVAVLRALEGEPPWLTIARKDLGVAEIPGPAAHPRIVEWFRYTTLRSTSDETPNCAAAVCAWLEEAGVPSTRSARARSYELWGRRIEPTRPIPAGAVVVFYRGRISAGTGHVALYVGGNPNAGLAGRGASRIAALGANQADSCNVAIYSAARVRGFYWPEGWAIPSRADWLPLDGVVAQEDWT